MIDKSGEIIIFAQAEMEVDPDIDSIILSVIEKYGADAYTQLVVDMGESVFIGLLAGDYDYDDEGYEIDDWSDL